MPELIGYIAATLTTGAFLPQAFLIWRTRRVSGISAGMYCIFSVGSFLWFLYGVLIHALPVIIANAITFSLNLWILSMKLRFDGISERALPIKGGS